MLFLLPYYTDFDKIYIKIKIFLKIFVRFCIFEALRYESKKGE